MKISVVGMGNSPKDISLAGAEAVAKAKFVLVKTSRVKPYGYFKNIPHICLDYIFEGAEDFERLYAGLASTVAEKALGGSVCYCVEGDAVSDRSVIELARLVPDLNIIAGCPSPAAAFASATGGAYTAVTASVLVSGFLPQGGTLAVTAVDDRFLASEVKLRLLEIYGGDTLVHVFSRGKTRSIPLTELDGQKDYGYDFGICVTDKAVTEKTRFTTPDLLAIMDMLMGEGGCPWDRVQTHESIRTNTLEEAYEVADAIDAGDPDMLLEETGDLLLQSVFHSKIAEKYGEFNYNDMITALCNKLVSRHTHVFGQNRAADSAEALKSWEAAKAAEKSQSGLSDKISCIPKAFPAMLRAEKILKYLAKAGRAANTAGEAESEFAAAAQGLLTAKDGAALGRLLLAAVNFARITGLDGERALKLAADGAAQEQI